MKLCVLEDRGCTNCGECDMCDLDPVKRCTSCCACIDTDNGNTRAVIIKKDPEERSPVRKIVKWTPQKQED